MAQMKQELFNELCESIKEAGQIKKGKKRPSRFYVAHADGAFAIRMKLGLSQSKFALLMGVTQDCVQNWEQGRRQPSGTAKVLLKIAEKHPRLVLEAVRE
jgi:putative transcriptional regulator